MKTATISVRVPIDFKKEIESICKTKSISISDYCIAKITPSTSVAPVNARSLQKLDANNDLFTNELPEELKDVLSVTGGLLVGTIVYNALKQALQKNNPEWTDDKLIAVSLAGGLASALLTGYGLDTLLKSE